MKLTKLQKLYLELLRQPEAYIRVLGFGSRHELACSGRKFNMPVETRTIDKFMRLGLIYHGRRPMFGRQQVGYFLKPKTEAASK